MKTRAERPPAKSPGKPVVRFRMRITAGEDIAIGPGKIALLEAIAETGSISSAAKSLTMSYRRAWLLLDELNASLKFPAVESSQGGDQGGGTVLTLVGEELIRRYRSVERTAEMAAAQDLKAMLKLMRRG